MLKQVKRFQALLLLAVGIALGYGLSTRGPAPAEAPLANPSTTCAQHGVAAAECVRCHPERAAAFQSQGDWCGEHGLPESQCVLCNPGLAAWGVKPIADAPDDPHAGHDPAPAVASSDAPAIPVEAFPGLSVVYRSNQPKCPTDQALIQFATAATAERAGLEVQPVITATESTHFEAPAEVRFDENATTVFTSTLPVSLVRWLVEPGDPVREGEALATAESPDMAMLQGEYLEAWSDWRVHDKERERTAGMAARGLVDSATYERAQGEATSARARWVQSESRLRLAGMAAEDLEALHAQGRVNSQFTLRSRRKGLLLERTAPLGRLLEPGTELARLGDPGAIWIEAHLRESDAARVKDGQRVEFAGDGGALHRVSGKVIWIASFLDPSSRTITVRVRPDRGDVNLRAHEFGRLYLPEGTAEVGLWVPRDAVQWEGCCNVVFVQEAVDRYRPRKVKVAAGDPGHYRVLDGLKPGEQVVVAGSFLLKTELKKGAIGAGCCGLEAS
jgi:cobalt-zinc-cadmium efflux system membrane fusion protein